MTDETGAEFWADVRPAMVERSKQRRASNRESSAELLSQAGVQFTSHNDGAHLVVSGRGHTFDFWPGTGLWKMRGSTQQHRGVRRLIKIAALKEQP